ncbi:hypothetical protein N3K66_004045 [Trichothecium roseum]|uniref:Uncharacterized protein n=1 Tax=Trichothecium roseum TaxID=47278 RepID=A0ACC0V765_9HYPO|nr:hypothetical protein N3K66_004045 [Trichothecium roseum]
MAFGKLMSNYVSASVALSFAGFLNGYDTGSIGGIAHMDQFAASLGPLSASTLGMTVSIIMLTGALPALFAGRLADKRGRLGVVMPGALLFALGSLLQATSSTLAQFVTGRAVSGVGQGAFLGNVSVYIAEVAPARRRGRLAALPQFMAALGVCVGYFCCFGTAGVGGSLAWRLPYVVPVAVSLGLALVCGYLPESPRWLVTQPGRAEDARAALELLDFDMREAERDILSAPPPSRGEEGGTAGLSHRQSLALLFRRGYRSRTFLALFVLTMVQLSGIDAITYYAPSLFSQAGVSSSTSSLVASGVASITMLAVSIPAFLLADKWGRRSSTISGGLALAALMFLVGGLYAAGAVRPDSGAARWVVIVCVFLFGMVFCATWGIVGKIYASEIQPGDTRAAGNALGMSFSFLSNFFVALVTPVLLAASAFGAYFLFGALALVTVAVLTVSMPETRGRSLEDIQSDFRRPATNALSGLLRLPGVRRRNASSTNDASTQGTELEPVEGQALASSVSVEVAARGLRVGAA